MLLGVKFIGCVDFHFNNRLNGQRTKLHLFLNLLIQENGIILISTKGKAMTDDFRNISMN